MTGIHPKQNLIAKSLNSYRVFHLHLSSSVGEVPFAKIKENLKSNTKNKNYSKNEV